MTNQTKMTVEVLRYNPEQDNEPFLAARYLVQGYNEALRRSF